MAPTDDAIFEEWLNALAMAFSFAKAARAAELRGDRRVKGFDGQGLHMYSTEWGRVWTCEELLPGLEQYRDLEGREAGPLTMRAMAAREAEDEFLADARAGTVEWHHT